MFFETNIFGLAYRLVLFWRNSSQYVLALGRWLVTSPVELNGLLRAFLQ